MRKFYFLLLFIACGFCAQAGVHRCGTYNIRVAGAQADTGERAWDSRKAALVSVLRDSMQFDIVGLNEVRQTALTYLQQQLGSTYTFVGNSSYIKNQILYRTDKYTLLDQGTFYLASNPAKPTISWDDTEVHLTVWAKLQDKQSGEILVFGSTHMSLYPVSQREGARINAEQMNLIAGDYACIVTGDMNVEPNEHDPLANFGKYMCNARQISKTEPQGSYGTYIPGMNPYTADAKLLDFLFIRNMEVEDYYTYDHATEGRTLAPSDHQPVVASLTILSPDREFVHTVKNVAELRKVAHAIQPNDIIYLKDGTYDLGDSTLHVANTCVIEGSKKTVLTGATQLFSLPDYISLELRNLSIRDASCATGAKGSIMHAHGAYIKMVDCTVENCSAVGDGLIYTEDCAATLENCVFSNNQNKDLCAGIQCTSSLGVDRYPLTIKSCLFDGNSSYYAPALYYASEATAYLYGNSFVHNTAEEKGAITIAALNNTKDIRLVNNTFVDNRIDVEAGFMVEGIGGSVIWQEQAPNGILTLMNNTIVGNYTACWDEPGVSSADFAGGAICAYAGKLALYNNILAGNYGSKPGSGDLTLGESGVIKATAYNIFSSSDNMGITAGKSDFIAANYATSCQELQNLFGGTVDEQGAYLPQLQKVAISSLPVLSPFVTTYAGNNIAVLDMDAMSASLLESDILNQGSNQGFLTKDQVSTIRNTYSVPGSMEAGQVDPSGLTDRFTDTTIHQFNKILQDGRILIFKDHRCYDVLGLQL